MINYHIATTLSIIWNHEGDRRQWKKSNEKKEGNKHRKSSVGKDNEEDKEMWRCRATSEMMKSLMTTFKTLIRHIGLHFAICYMTTYDFSQALIMKQNSNYDESYWLKYNNIGSN